MAITVTYEVGVTLCNGRNFKHGHDDLGEATREYSWFLAAALDPAMLSEPDAKHVRMVTLLGFDELNQVTQHVTSPIFECDDRVTAA